MTTTLTERPLTTADAAAIAAVLAAMEGAEPADELYTEDDVLEQLQSPSVDLEHASVGLYDGAQLVGFGVPAVSAKAPVWKVTLFGGVLPEYNGQGIGRRIIDEFETMAVRDRDDQAPGRPAELKVYVHESRSRTAHLMEAAGYERWRYFFRMRRELAGALPAIDVPSGVRIRRYRDADDEPLRLVSNESFADHWGSSPLEPGLWRAQFAGSVAARPAHSWVAVDNGGADDNDDGHAGDNADDGGDGDPADGGDFVGDIVSFVLCEEYDGDTELRGFRSGYLGRIGTVRRARGRGVATALIATTLAGMAADGYRRAELDVDSESPTGAGRIYQRLGFAPFARSVLYGKHF